MRHLSLDRSSMRLVGCSTFLALCCFHSSFLVPSVFQPAVALAQENDATAEKQAVAEIKQQPSHIPPQDILPEVLKRPLTADFPATPLSEIVDWLRKELQLTVLLDEVALQKLDVLPSDAISLKGEFETAYGLLERLSAFKIGWYLDGNVLHLTTVEEADGYFINIAHNIGPLLDQKYEAENLEALVLNSIGGSWGKNDLGSMIRLGDVLFVRQNMAVQLRVEALLQALESPAERVLLMQSDNNQKLRQQLMSEVSVSFSETPLDVALSEISQQIEAEIVLDVDSLEDLRIRSNRPVSLSVQSRSALQTLQFLLQPLSLASVVKNDRIVVMTQQSAERLPLTAVFDVRDLCQNRNETFSLMDAFDQQGDFESVYYAKHGVIVLRDIETNLDNALTVLNNYRIALKSSKPRIDAESDPHQILTVYYRMPSTMASSIKENLVALVGKSKWNTDIEKQHDDTGLQAGTILQLESAPELIYSEDEEMAQTVVAQSTLVITHSREVHQLVEKCLRRVYHGSDQSWLYDTDGEGGGLGGGGFGGGLFDVPPVR